MRRMAFLSLILSLPLGAQQPAEDIRGPKPPIEVPAGESAAAWPLYALFALLLLLLAVGTFWWMKRRQRPQVSAEQWARQELDGLERSGGAMPAGDFALAASRVVRVFVERKFGVAAPKRTTEEFLQELARSENEALVSRSHTLRGFLASCDMAKFAGTDLEAAERGNLVANAKAFIEGPSQPDTKEAA